MSVQEDDCKGAARRGKEFTVLVDAAGTATAISVIKGLRHQEKYGCRIVTIDTDPFVAGRYLSDKFHVVPPARDPNAIDNLLRICEVERVDLLVPIFDLWLAEISRATRAFQQIGTFPLVSPEETIDICVDKYKTFLFFKENKIPAVRTLSRGFAMKRARKGALSFPLFLKPRIGGRASLNTFKVANKPELLFHILQSGNWVVQEFIDGQEYTLDCLNTLSGKECLAVVVRKRIETKGGLSVKAEVVRDEELVEYAVEIGQKLKMVGPYNIQCFRDKHGEPWFTEINPRFAGTHAFSIVAGLNSIVHVLDMLSGIRVAPLFGQIKVGLKMVRFWNEIIVHDEKGSVPWQFL